MFEINKYCFFSDKIENHVLVYNSQNNAMLVLTFMEYDYLMRMVMKTQVDIIELPKAYVDFQIVVKKCDNCFNIKIFNSIIESMLTSMESCITFLIVMEKTYAGERWIINLNEFSECISAITRFCMQSPKCNVLLILQYENAASSKFYEKIIADKMKNINYSVEIRTLKGDLPRDNINDKINDMHIWGNDQGKNDNTILSKNSAKVSTNIEIENFTDFLNNNQFKDDLCVKKSIRKYVSEIKSEQLFSKEISVLNLLCPNLLKHFYIIEHAKLVKKCLCQPPSHDNIVGVICNKEIMLNENIKKYSLSINRLHNDCYKCRYVYICMGQNCRVCLNQNTIICMPFGKFIRMNLNRKLLLFMHKKE